jgi:hypothetical protein
MLDGKTFPNLLYTFYVHNMCSGATLTRSGHFLGMKPIGKKFIQYISCMDEHMKARMLEVYMAMMGNHLFPKDYVCFIVAQMVYVEMVLGVPVD